MARNASSEEAKTTKPSSTCPSGQVEWAWLGRVLYEKASALQERIREQVASGREGDALLLLEHDPVITLGRNANPAHVIATPERLAKEGIPVIRTSRGGDVTFHGYGQLVGYPIFRLRRGIRAHVRAMADGLIAVLGELGIVSEWRDSHPGIWVGNEKICAVGVHVRHRVSIHGFALNANIDLTNFQTIVPCGLHAFHVTSIEELLGSSPCLEFIAERVAHAFMSSFDINMVRISALSSRLQNANENL